MKRDANGWIESEAKRPVIDLGSTKQPEMLKESDWWVYSTAVGTGVIMVEDRNNGTLGWIEDYSREEWQAAFYAPSTPYRWPDPSRVVGIHPAAPEVEEDPS